MIQAIRQLNRNIPNEILYCIINAYQINAMMTQ